MYIRVSVHVAIRASHNRAAHRKENTSQSVIPKGRRAGLGEAREVFDEDVLRGDRKREERRERTEEVRAGRVHFVEVHATRRLRLPEPNFVELDAGEAAGDEHD